MKNPLTQDGWLALLMFVMAGAFAGALLAQSILAMLIGAVVGVVAFMIFVWWTGL